jgi:hypothetical protein
VHYSINTLLSVVFDKKKWFVTTNMTILHESTHKSRVLHGFTRKYLTVHILSAYITKSPLGKRAEAVDKVVFTTLSSYSLTSLHNGCAIVRPFARAK